MCYRHRYSVRSLLICVSVLVGGSAAKGAEDSGAPIPAGYRPHVQVTPGGRIDWARGEIEAEGLGRAKSRSEQDKRMAERAAEVVAARNAAALALGLYVDRNGPLANVKDGEIHVEALLRRHEKVSTTWNDAARPPECRVKLRAPIWGVKGVASVVFEEQYTRARASARRPLVPARVGDPGPEEYLIIDARGTGLRPCLYPLVTTNEGGVVYNLAIRRQVHGDILPVVYYVEEDIAAETRTEKAETSNPAPGKPVKGESAKEASEKEDVEKGDRSAPEDAEEAPAKKPAQESDKPARAVEKRSAKSDSIHIQAYRAGGVNRTDIVILQGVYKRLADDPRAVRMLRHGRVLVVVDPAP